MLHVDKLIAQDIDSRDRDIARIFLRYLGLWTEELRARRRGTRTVNTFLKQLGVSSLTKTQDFSFFFFFFGRVLRIDCAMGCGLIFKNGGFFNRRS